MKEYTKKGLTDNSWEWEVNTSKEVLENRLRINQEKQKDVEKRAEKKAIEEKLRKQRIEEYTFKGSDLKSVTNSFIEKMSSLSSGSMTGFDIMV
mgnify:CR=1 FL=1